MDNSKPKFSISTSMSSDYEDLGLNGNANPQLMPYYPKYSYLDNLLSCNPKKTINIFVDVKGCCTGIYQEWCVLRIINSSKSERHLNLDLFSSLLYFIAFHKKYAVKRDVKFNIIFFMEQGRSKYHLNIYDKYKENRQNSDFFGLDTKNREEFFGILDKNYSLCEYVINRIPDCSFYCLKHCEADFIPYYVMKYEMTPEQRESSLNIIYSRDKDMLQCLEFENSYQYYRAMNCDKTEYITQDTLFTHFCKMDCNPIKDAAKWFPLVLSLCGDTGDGIPGIKGLGPKVIYKNIDTIMKAFNYDADKMYDRVLKADNILTESWEYSSTSTLTKIFSHPDIVSRNMKLISYRALSEYLNGGFPTSTIEIKQYIDKIYKGIPKLSSYKILWDNINKKGLSDIVDIRTIEECFL